MKYLSHAATGQLTMEWNKQSVDQLKASLDTPEQLKQRLLLTDELKVYARENTLLPLTDEFSTYVHLDREHVLWSLFVVPAYDLSPKPWCYPIAGCISYRSFFDYDYASEQASFYKAQGYDVYIAPAAAYSTLGWFSDPLLNTYIYSRDDRLASIMYHELGHQLFYIPSDLLFNEAFASFVERYYVVQWLKQSGRDKMLGEFVEGENRYISLLQLMTQTQKDLKSLYASSLPEEEMRLEKHEITSAFQERYKNWRNEWDGYAGYDRWLNSGINNAKLATLSTYYRWIPVFEWLLEKNNCNFQQLMNEVDKLAELSIEERKNKFEGLLQSIPKDKVFTADQCFCQ